MPKAISICLVFMSVGEDYTLKLGSFLRIFCIFLTFLRHVLLDFTQSVNVPTVNASIRKSAIFFINLKLISRVNTSKVIKSNQLIQINEQFTTHRTLRNWRIWLN